MLHESIPAFPGRTFRQYLTTNYHHINRRGPGAGPGGLGRNNVNWIVEPVTATQQMGTHLDGLNHLQAVDRTYSGFRLADIVEDYGTNRLGIGTLPQIVTRGLLLDVAAARGGDRLGPGEVITVADAEAALAADGLAVRPGDAVLLPHRLGPAVGYRERTLRNRGARRRAGPGRMARRPPGGADPGVLRHQRGPPRPGRPAALARVPLFLLALLVARGVPALLGLRTNGPRSTLALGLLQATSLPFIVTATQIGVTLGKITPGDGGRAGLRRPAVGADLPLLALSLLRRSQPAPAGTAVETASVPEPQLM